MTDGKSLMVLYIDRKTYEQTWALYCGGHEEADKELFSMKKDKRFKNLQEIHRVWIHPEFYADGRNFG